MRTIQYNRCFWTLLILILITLLFFLFQSVEITTQSKLTNQPDIYTKEYQIMRRNLHANLWQMHYFLNTQKLNGTFPEFDIFTEYLLDQTISMLAESENLRSINNGDEWHRSELQKITNFIQNRLYQFQHPKSCSEARFLICQFWICGLACIIHRAGYCLRVASVSNRTLIIGDESLGNYSKNGWTSIFQPISNCSFRELDKVKMSNWTSIEQTDRVTVLTREEWNAKRPDQLPLSFPIQLAEKLFIHHSNPALFFGAQFYWYLTRTNKEMTKIINGIVDKINLNTGPIVGIHIRRTDKKHEAEYYPVEDYFKWVEKWFKIQERRSVGGTLKRRVYIATDEPEVIDEAKKKFPNYEIYADIKISKIAQLDDRYTEESLRGIFADIKILSKCDFVVCTLSSNVGRLVYSFLLMEKGDVTHNLHSLDISYGDFMQHDHEFIAIADHIPKREEDIELKINDTLFGDNYEGNLYNGYGIAENRRTQHRGYYPSYKVRYKWRIVDFPIFEP